MPYRIFILSAILMALVNMGVCQTLEPTSDRALITILVLDPKEQPISERIELVAKSTGEIYTANSNTKGMAALLVPAGDTYTLNMKYAKKYDVFYVPDNEYYTLNYKIYYDNTAQIPENYMQISLRIITDEGDPLPGEKVYLLGGTERISGITDEEGKLEMNIPNNTDYVVEFDGAPNYEKFSIPDEVNYIMNFTVKFNGSGKDIVYPTLDKALIDFTYLDLDDNPVINDTFTIREIGGDGHFECLTDDEGKVCVLVPTGSSYSFSTPMHQDFQSCSLPGEQKRQTISITFKGLSSTEYYSRLAKRREDIRIRDSIYLARQIAYEEFKKLSPEEKKEWKKKDIQERANTAKKALKKDPEYFEIIEETVNAALYRNLKFWKNQIIVTDVTGSMNPYIDQVLLWHAMNLMIEGNIEYIFFNDGDRKPQKDKLVGLTGGIYYTDATEFDSVVHAVWHVQSCGGGGDCAENDFEALLEAVKFKTPLKEIILIADNYSDVRDYELLSRINVPVRIILCGVQDHVNEQYLDLAYHTKGSVHTLEEDLQMLSRLADGKSITFMGKEYVLSKGRFVFK